MTIVHFPRPVTCKMRCMSKMEVNDYLIVHFLMTFGVLFVFCQGLVHSKLFLICRIRFFHNPGLIL